MTEKSKAVEQTLYERYVAAWGDVSNPELDSVNDHFNSKYASLKSTLDVIREACAKHGIMYLQTLTPVENGYVMRSSVVSPDGEAIERSVFPVETPPNIQTFGSLLTYTKRQQAQADWGITGEPEDDGNKAADDAPTIGAGRKGGKAPAPKPKGKWDRFKELKAEAVSLGIKEDAIKEWMDATFKGKDVKAYTKGDINICEGHVMKLIDDMRTIKARGVSDAQAQDGVLPQDDEGAGQCAADQPSS